jgi:hypothetical protein
MCYIAVPKGHMEKQGGDVKPRWTLLLLLVLVAAPLWAQYSSPATPPASGAAGRDEIAGGATMMFRGMDQSLNPSEWKLGGGGEISIARYFSKHFGLTAGADLLYTRYLNFWEYGYRAGPVIRFRPNRRVQPFVRAMGGFSRYKEDLTGGRYVNGGSFLAGGGIDWRLDGGLSLRTALDYEQNPVTPLFGKTRYLRFTLGFKYVLPSDSEPQSPY